MANHCVDVICLACGNNWCAVGCGNKPGGKDKRALLRFLKGQQEWADEHAKGNLHAAITISTGDLCNACGSNQIAIQ
jgi:hypothetical protein